MEVSIYFCNTLVLQMYFIYNTIIINLPTFVCNCIKISSFLIQYFLLELLKVQEILIES